MVGLGDFDFWWGIFFWGSEWSFCCLGCRCLADLGLLERFWLARSGPSVAAPGLTIPRRGGMRITWAGKARTEFGFYPWGLSIYLPRTDSSSSKHREVPERILSQLLLLE